jgi:hypothetical protein
MDKKIEKNAVKSHRERVDEMNKFLDSLSDVRSPLYDAYSSTMTCLKSDLAKTLSIICLFANSCHIWDERLYYGMHGG